MAYGTISNEWLNRNNLETLWAAIVRDFVHAGASPVSGGDGGTTKGSMLYWGQTSTPTGTGQPIQPSHLQIGSTGQLLGVSEGIPEWTTPQLQQAGGVGSTPLTLYLKNASSVALSLQTAGASQWGIITDQAQTLGGEKTFNETIKGKKNIEADWGVAAEGIADLSLSSGGGGGTVTRLILCGTQYDPTSGVITVPTASLQSDLGLGSAAYKNVGVVASGNSGLVTGDAVSSAINDALTAAMKIEGETTTNVKDNPSANPVVIDGQSVTAYKGMVVFYNSKEFVWTGSSWKELGDESSFALKTTTITGTGYLTGGGSIAESRTLDIADTVKGKINTAYSHATDSGRLTTAQTSGLYKFSVTSEGHIGSVTAMTENDITGLISNTLGTITSSIGQVYAIAQNNTENITLHDERLSDIESYFDGDTANKAHKLATARTIWGQSFDGSANVSGAMSGVTNINTLVYFGTNVGIGTSSPDSKLHVAGTFKATGNSLIGGTLGVSEDITGNKNIQAHWGVSAQGICDLSLSSGGGGGTIIGVYVNGQTYTSVNAGILTLPDYPTVEDMIEDGLASEEWVQQQITNLNLGTASTHAHTDYVTDITWDSTNRKLKQSKGGGTATDIVQFGTVYSHGHDEYLTDLGVSGNTLTWSKGGVAQTALTVPYATLSTDTKTELLTGQEFTYRQTAGGGLTYKPSVAVLKRILGRTLVWNQLVSIPSTSKTHTWGSFTITDNRDGSYTLNGTIDESGVLDIRPVPMVAGHKYLVKCSNPAIANTNLYFGSGASSNPVRHYLSTADGTIYQSTRTAEEWCYFEFSSGTFDNLKIYPQVIDLTLMFGAGNEPSTVEEFEALYPNAYYEYNAGTLINNACSGLESVGFNLWDEEWEVGDIDVNTGQKFAYDSCIRSTNYNPCFSNTEYYITSAGKSGRLFWYDANKNFINIFEFGSNRLATSPSNACYIRFAMFDSYGTTYNHDICINLSDPNRNGQYEPYKKNVLPLNFNSFRVKDAQGNISTINGLKMAGSVYDEIVGKKFIQRVGSVDLGTLTWNFYPPISGGTKDGRMYATGITNMKLADVNSLANILCPKFITDTALNTYNHSKDKAISLDGFTVLVYDSDYTSSDQIAAFQAAMSGVYLYYELATPIEYEIVDDFPTTYPIDVLGTESIPEGEMVAPFVADIQYGAEQRDIAVDINNVFTGLTSRIDAMDISHYQSGQTSPVDSHLITINGKKFYVRFSAVNGGGSSSGSLPSFELAMADNPNGENEQVFSFGTITEQWILDNCKLS